MNLFNFPDQIAGFSRVEYLSIFITLLYAFAIAEFFSGWGKMMRHREVLIFDSQHMLWTFIFFWGLLLNWYGMWARIAYIDKGFVYFILILIPILLIFPATVFLFPDLDKTQDLKTYYAKNRSTIIFLFSVTLLTNSLIGIVMKESLLASPVFAIRFLLSISGIMTWAFKWKRLEGALSYVFLISLVAGTAILLISGE